MMLLDTDSALLKGQSYPWRCLNIVDLWVDYPVTCEGSVAVPGPADQQGASRERKVKCKIPCDCPLGAYRAIAGRVDIPTFVLHRLGAALPIHGRPDGS